MAKKLPPIEEMFSKYYEVETAGRRTGLMSCFVCGATIILSQEDPWIKKRHYHWHSKIQWKQKTSIDD